MIMEKMKSFAFQSLVALAGVFAFTACSSSDEASVDPNPIVEGESVKTQFTISLPDNITRMAGSEVQATSTDFRGIDQIKLVPYSLTSGDVLGTSAANARLIDLSAISKTDLASESKSKVYADVELVNGTSNFLFYGKAIDNAAGVAITTPADKFKFGTLSVENLSGNPTLANVEFTPEVIYNAASDEEKAVGANLIALLNAVANATPKDYNASSELEDATLSDGTAPKFKDVTIGQSATINKLFAAFKELSTSSSKNVRFALLSICKNLDGNITSAARATAPNTYKMAVGIRAKIAEYCNITFDGTQTTDLTLKTDLTAPITGYPANVNLPDGSARITYSEGVFVATTSATIPSGMNVAALDKYVYPANLQYFVNSPVKVSDNVLSPSYGTKTWAEILAMYTGSAVTDNTHSVAITNPVQYGVARLDASVAALKTDATVYKDYKGTEVDVTAGFTLTGILIGGQKSVGWDFTKKGTTEYTIYDNVMPGAALVKRGTGTGTNYTLVLQTGDETADQTVNVALEFINNGDDFLGAKGEVIHSGATFYLVGTLKTAEGSKADGASDDVTKRVFTQDTKTVVTFTIKPGTGNDGAGDDEEGLGTATKGLPDLRTPQMELGLSVNLEWQPGLTFDINI